MRVKLLNPLGAEPTGAIIELPEAVAQSYLVRRLAERVPDVAEVLASEAQQRPAVKRKVKKL